MTADTGCPRERRFGTARMLIPVLTGALLLLAARASNAQEVIDPRSGRPHLTVTDLVLPAGLVPAAMDLLPSLPSAADPAPALFPWRAE